MRIGHISDLHADFHISPRIQNKNKIERFVDRIMPDIPTDIDILIVPGDISHYNSLSINVLKELKRRCGHVLVTFGNHDLYLVSKKQQSVYMYDSFRKAAEFKNLCEKNGIYCMDSSEPVEINGLKICGMPGWYEVKDIRAWATYMNDANYIMKGFPNIRINYLYGDDIIRSFNPNDYFKEQFQKFEKIKNADILFSHIAFLNLEKEKNLFSNYYFWNGELSQFALDKMKKAGVKYYIFGHTHQKTETELEGIKILNNPLGYKLKNQKIEVFQV